MFITHHRAHKLLQVKSDQGLSASAQAILDAHLAECPECRSYAAKLDKLENHLQRLFNSRWNRIVPLISTNIIQQRLRRATMHNKVFNVLKMLAATGIFIFAFLVANTYFESEVFVSARSTPSTYPPEGIGTICQPTSPNPTHGTGSFIWPVQSQLLSKDYSKTHPAIDIAGNKGDVVQAVDSGVVVVAGWSTWGYGNLVIIDHGENLYTLYAHLDQIMVVCGQNINQGDPIGYVGETGNVSDPRLHFQIRVGEQFKNPLDFLPH